MRIKNIVLYSLLIFSLSPCWAQQPYKAEKEAFMEKIYQWLAPYQNEKNDAFMFWYIWNTQMRENPSQRFDDPTYKHLMQFVNENKDTYRRFRLESLRSYPSAPKELPGYSPTDIKALVEDWEAFEQSMQFVQDISNIHTLDMNPIRMNILSLSSLIFPPNPDENEMAITDVPDHNIHKQMYADKIDDSYWKITLIDKLFVIRVNWNIDTNQFEELEILMQTNNDK